MFRNRKIVASALPSDIVRKMELYGQFEINPTDADGNTANMVAKLLPELSPMAAADPDRFISELAAAVLPHAGWAVYGGERLVGELVDRNSRHPDFLKMFDAAMAFLRSQGHGPPTLSEMKLWHELHPGESWQ